MRWTDKKVKEFCKIYTNKYLYDGYQKCTTIESKMKKYKELKGE